MKKWWLPLALAVINLVGVIAVAYFQSKSASREEVNQKTLPNVEARIAEEVHKLDVKIAELKGKLSVLESNTKQPTVWERVVRDKPKPIKVRKPSIKIPRLEQKAF